MKRKTRKLTSLLLALAMALILLPATAMAEAEQPDIVASGTCGANLTWKLDREGLLTISGTGKMTEAPWLSDYSRSVKTVVIESGVTTIGEGAFRDTYITAITIPGTVTEIEKWAFLRCNGLKSIAIPDSVTTIGAFAFSACGLRSVDLPANLTSLSSYLFDGCTDLTSVTIPGSLTRICGFTFYNCRSLTAVTIPDSVGIIEQHAFSRCTALQSVTFAGHAPQIYYGAFMDVTASVYYPAGDATWTESVRKNYDGILTWTPYTPLVITAQPDDVTVTAGARATFTVAAGGTGLTYQWQYLAPGGSWKNSGASSAKTATLSFNATAAQNGYKYRCVVKNSSGASATSNAATLTVGSSAPSITQQPASVTVAAGGKAAFSVTAGGTGLTYQWQYLAPGGSWKNSGASSAKTATLSFNATAAHNGYKYRCIVTGGSQSVTSNAATLTVGSSAPSITKQPANVTVAAGGKAAFSVTAGGTGLTYQWQYLAPGGSWKNSGASSAKTATLSFNANAGQNGYKYRCVVKNSGGASATSNAATLTVGSSSAPSITKQPASVTVAAGGKAAFSVTASGTGLTYQWQYLAPGGSWKNSGASSGKTATLSFNATAAQNGYQYRCIVKNSSGASVTSSAATLTVR